MLLILLLSISSTNIYLQIVSITANMNPKPSTFHPYAWLITFSRCGLFVPLLNCCSQSFEKLSLIGALLCSSNVSYKSDSSRGRCWAFLNTSRRYLRKVAHVFSFVTKAKLIADIELNKFICSFCDSPERPLR